MMVSLGGLWAPTWPSHALPITILLVLLTSVLGLTYLSLQRSNPKEPPIVHPWPPVPYLGHLIRMALQGGHYIRTLGLSHPTLPMFTLVVPFSRLYGVTSPSLAAAIQRKPTRQLDFNTLLPDVVQRVLGLDDETRGIVERGIQSSEGGGQMGFLEELHGMLTGYLGPGKLLEDLTLQSAKELSEELNGYFDSVLTQGGKGEDGKTENLLAWVRPLVAKATARLLYGPRNPLVAHPELDLEQSFWDWDHGLGQLLIGVVPSITARRAYRGREKLVAAFWEYVGARHYAPDGQDGGGASQIVLNRICIAESHGFRTGGIARSELSFLFAGIVNTATTTFWTLLHVFSDARLRDTVRSELDGVVESTSEGRILSLGSQRGGLRRVRRCMPCTGRCSGLGRTTSPRGWSKKTSLSRQPGMPGSTFSGRAVSSR